MTAISQLTEFLRTDGAKGVPSILMLAMSFTLAPFARGDAVVTLCHLADESGPGVNLRNALVAQPNPNTLLNTVTFQCNGPATIELRLLDKPLPSPFPLNIFQSTVIDGGSTITLVGGPGGLILVAGPGVFFYLKNVTMRNPFMTPNCAGWLTGGCTGSVLAVQGNVQGVTELHDVRIENSHTPVSVMSGTLGVYDNSQFTGNTDAVIVAAPGVTSTTIDHSTFQNNPGAPPIEAIGNVNITSSQFVSSGAMILERAGRSLSCKVTIDRSTFQANNTNGALSDDCDSTITNSIFKNNVATTSVGGAIDFGASATAITLRADKFLTNSAFRGGAVYCFWAPQANRTRTLTVLYSTFVGNKAVGNKTAEGGAILVGNSPVNPPAVIHVGVSYFSKNVSSGDGGAIFATSSELNIARAGFANNTAVGNGGAVLLSNASQLHSVFANTMFVHNKAQSGSAFYGDNADFINSTVDSNAGLAISNQASHSPVHIKFTNSIVSNNPQGGCGPAGLFDDGGHNLQFPGKDCGGSISVANPHLDTMFIPLPKSPPMGNGDLKVCMSPPVNGRDVYGVGRPSGGACTIGAAEGDVEILNRGKKKTCDCGLSLLQQLQRLLPFGGARTTAH